MNTQYLMNPKNYPRSWIALLQEPIDVEDTDVDYQNEEVYEIDEEEGEED